MTNYELSNELTIPNLNVNSRTKILYAEYREVKAITQQMLQTLSNAIFEDLGLRALVITLKGKRPHKTDGKRIVRQTLGVHRSAMLSQSIQIYKLTAARGQLVSAKSAISTLLHEINHNIDINILKLNSIHCKGFYLRLKQLTDAMK